MNSNRQWIGGIGAALLFGGVFAPAFSGPFGVGVNLFYFEFPAYVVLVAAGGALLATVTRKYQFVLLSGIVAGLASAYVATALSPDGVYGALIQWAWGWVLLGLGVGACAYCAIGNFDEADEEEDISPYEERIPRWRQLIALRSTPAPQTPHPSVEVVVAASRVAGQTNTVVNVESVPSPKQMLHASIGDEKTCPYCAEVIKAEAVKCRHCGSDVSRAQIVYEAKSRQFGQPVSGRDYYPGKKGVGLSILFLAVVVLFFTNPTKTDFRDYFIKQINASGTVDQSAVLDRVVTNLMRYASDAHTIRQNYVLFSTFEIDTSLARANNPNWPRVRGLGILGSVIPLDDYSGFVETLVIAEAIEHGLSAASELKAVVTEFYAYSGEFPATCHQVVAECASHLSVETGGNIMIDLGSTGGRALAGRTIKLSPSATQNGDVVWACSSDAPSRYLPASCVAVKQVTRATESDDHQAAARMADDAATSAVASAPPADQSQLILPATPEGADKSASSIVVFSAINGGGLPVARCNSSEVITALRRYIAEAIHAEPGRGSGDRWWDVTDVFTTSDLGGRQECAASIQMGYADKTLDSIPMTYATSYEDARLTVQVTSWELQPLMEPGGAAVSGSCENGASNMAEVYTCELAKTEATVDGAEMELRAVLSRGGFSEQMIAMRRSQEDWKSARDSDCQQDYDEAEKKVGGYAESNRLECIQSHNEGRIEELRAYAEVCGNGDRSACVVE